MSNLYKTNERFIELRSQLEREDGIISNELEQELLKNEAQLQEKCSECCFLIKHISSDIDAIDEMIKSLQKRKKSMENQQESIKGAICNAMEFRGIKTIKTPYFTISMSSSKEKIEIPNENELPPECFKITEVRKVDKEKVRELIENNVPIQARLIKSSHITIRQ